MKKVVFSLVLFVFLSYPAYAEDWQTAAIRIAKQYDIEPRVVLALILVESNGNTDSVNPRSGAVCLMQVVPMRGRPTRSQLLGDVETCIETGVQILRIAIDATPSLDHAVSAYNTGIHWYRTRGVNWHMVQMFRDRYANLVYAEPEYVPPKGIFE